jgi:hypothetical protein
MVSVLVLMVISFLSSFHLTNLPVTMSLSLDDLSPLSFAAMVTPMTSSTAAEAANNLRTIMGFSKYPTIHDGSPRHRAGTARMSILSLGWEN